MSKEEVIYLTAKEARFKYPKQYADINNSKFKVDEVVRNINNGYIGPVQIIVHSMGRVQYYHGNNPCRDEDLEKFVVYKRRSLIHPVPVSR